MGSIGHRNPIPTVDAVIELPRGIVLIRRRNPPPGWALPGGFVDRGETVGEALLRETREETGLTVIASRLLGAYSDPTRDPRGPTVGLVFVVDAEGEPKADDDAAALKFFA